MQKTRIDWGLKNLYTWNPCVGCRRNCHFCYARKIHQRFHPKEDFTRIAFYPERMMEPLHLKKPANIFVGSMSDIAFWPDAIMNSVIQVCKDSPLHQFLFLTKNAETYPLYEWPENCTLGLTLTGLETPGFQEGEVATMAKLKNPTFISVEPLLGRIQVDLSTFNRVIVGALTGGTHPARPKASWVASVINKCPYKNIFWKPSMKDWFE